MEEKEFQDGIIELITLNNILLQILLFKQKTLVEGFMPTREGIIIFANGLLDAYPDEEKYDILAYIHSIEDFTDIALDDIMQEFESKDKKNNKPKTIKIC